MTVGEPLVQLSDEQLAELQLGGRARGKRRRRESRAVRARDPPVGRGSRPDACGRGLGVRSIASRWRRSGVRPRRSSRTALRSRCGRRHAPCCSSATTSRLARRRPCGTRAEATADARDGRRWSGVHRTRGARGHPRRERAGSTPQGPRSLSARRRCPRSRSASKGTRATSQRRRGGWTAEPVEENVAAARDGRLVYRPSARRGRRAHR